ncbi:MAG TPA: hypothetical protein VFE61_21385 [Candidatus Sulfotelmatobacter sp.]|jgi:hypothetical protein|nr:hypothetical protein [Candidatus Sulfotelmatobacter sp.]
MDESTTKGWLFHGSSGTTNQDIIRWWETRRLHFNLHVGLTGFGTWWLGLIVGGASVKPGVDFEEPFAMILGPIVYAILANVCYTFGWILAVVTYNDGPRKALCKAGLIFSIILTALPGVWAIIAYLITVYTGQKMD